eukprot:1155807-Pelagomonas_calceolata.AAC.3
MPKSLLSLSQAKVLHSPPCMVLEVLLQYAAHLPVYNQLSPFLQAITKQKTHFSIKAVAIDGFFTSVETANSLIAQVMRTYARYGVVPVIESPVSNSSELRRVPFLSHIQKMVARRSNKAGQCCAYPEAIEIDGKVSFLSPKIIFIVMP